MPSDREQDVQRWLDRLAAESITERMRTLEQLGEQDPELEVLLLERLESAVARTGFLDPPTRPAIKSAITPERLLGRTFGDFRLIRQIGHGGMGAVYEAEQISPRRRVAVKVLQLGQATSGSLRRFELESEVLARLSHPSIAQVFDAGIEAHDDRDIPWMALELVEGARSLTKFAKEQELERAQRLRLFCDVCDAMQHAHQRGIVHRDLKPDNVLVGPDGVPKVIDFGIARDVDEDLGGETLLTRSGELLGTLLYMSPEQMDGDARDIDTRVDVYALGVLLYELLTDCFPYAGRTTSFAAVVRAIRDDDPPAPSKRQAGIARDLDLIVARAMAKDREQRYASAEALADDVRRYLRREPIVARAPSLRYQARLFARRNPGLAGALLLGAASLIAIAWLGVSHLRANAELRRTGKKLADANSGLEETAVALDEALRSAQQRNEEVARLAALRELRKLESEEQALWPPHPERLHALRAWRDRAESILGQLPEHRATLDRLRARARPPTAEERDADERDDPRVDALDTAHGELEMVDSILRSPPPGFASDELEARRARIVATIEELEASRDLPWRWRFESDGDTWWHDELEDLVDALEALGDPDEGILRGRDTGGRGWSVERRIAFAERLELELAVGGAWRDRWDRVIPEVLDVYGIELPLQVGLVPIGPDRESGLMEFWHVASGAEPLRDDDGRLEITPESGVVVALVPGGSFAMGAQRRDPSARNYDPSANTIEGPVHDVELRPFFLAKHELTQAQWSRLDGTHPSRVQYDTYHPLFDRTGTPELEKHPVERISWDDCIRVLPRFGLSLPAEAEWEFAARAFEPTPWSSGGDPHTLGGFANLADLYMRRRGVWTDRPFEDWLDDGHAFHGAVDRFEPNRLGFVGMHGNVRELCLDGYQHYLPTPAQNPVGDHRTTPDRVTRGGGWSDLAIAARVSAREIVARDTTSDEVGVRPVWLPTGRPNPDTDR